MKKLKLDHDMALLVLSGEKTSTWRLFDDKDITVNDTLELVDKVKPHEPQTWRVIGTATVRRVIEKRLREITSDDLAAYDTFDSTEHMFETLRDYYGSNVTQDTPVKIIEFEFEKTHERMKQTQDAEKSAEEIKIFADGGSRGNPGPSASGYVLLDSEDKVLVDKGVYLGITTNNQAEYTALKLALEEALAMKARSVEVYMDSLLVVNQMKGVFKVRNRDLWPIHDAIKQLVKQFSNVSFTHVPRELNKLADAAVNRALDEQVSLGRS